MSLAGSLAVLLVDVALNYSGGSASQLMAFGAAGFGHHMCLRRVARERMKGDRGPWNSQLIIMAIGLPCLILASAHWTFFLAALIGGSCFAAVIMTVGAMMISEKSRQWRLLTLAIVTASLSLVGVLGQAALAASIDHDSAVIFGFALVWLPTQAGLLAHMTLRRRTELEASRQHHLQQDMQRQSWLAERIRKLRHQHGETGPRPPSNV